MLDPSAHIAAGDGEDARDFLKHFLHAPETAAGKVRLPAGLVGCMTDGDERPCQHHWQHEYDTEFRACDGIHGWQPPEGKPNRPLPGHLTKEPDLRDAGQPAGILADLSASRKRLNVCV